MTQDNDETQVTVDADHTFALYEDRTLTEMQPDSPVVNQREPFNDTVKHGDIIVGHQRNRTLLDYPRRTRPWVRVYATMSLVLIALGIILDLVHW